MEIVNFKDILVKIQYFKVYSEYSSRSPLYNPCDPSLAEFACEYNEATRFFVPDALGGDPMVNLNGFPSGKGDISINSPIQNPEPPSSPYPSLVPLIVKEVSPSGLPGTISELKAYQKCVRVWPDKIQMVVDRHIKVLKVIKYNDTTLLRRFYGKFPRKGSPAKRVDLSLETFDWLFFGFPCFNQRMDLLHV
jgi:hypothetical protein